MFFADDLPFHDVLTEEEIHAAFVAEDACFGEHKDDIYTPALTLWAWLSQVMHDREGTVVRCSRGTHHRPCAWPSAASLRRPIRAPTAAPCAKVPEAVIRRLVYTLGDGWANRACPETGCGSAGT